MNLNNKQKIKIAQSAAVIVFALTALAAAVHFTKSGSGGTEAVLLEEQTEAETETEERKLTEAMLDVTNEMVEKYAKIDIEAEREKTAESETVEEESTEDLADEYYCEAEEETSKSTTKLTEEDLNDIGKINAMIIGLAREHQEIMEQGSKVDALAQSMGISTKEVGSSSVVGLTEDSEPYYSILQSVNAIGYYWIIKGDIADTVHLFYQTQDGEVVYYGLVDLQEY